MSPTTIRLGLDIGGSKIHAVALPGTGVGEAAAFPSVLAEARRSSGQGPVDLLASALAAVQDLRDQLPAAVIESVGVGVPGLVDPDGAVQQAFNLGLTEEPLPLRAALAAALGVPVAVENDVSAAAWGTARWLPTGTGDTGVPDLAFLNIGTGLAAGLVLDGRLRRGQAGMAGEIGHLVFDPAGPDCSCGQRGCLELYASGSALSRAWPSVGGRAAGALLDAAAAGDHSAQAVLDRFWQAVASAIHLLVLPVDPRWVVIGGGVTQVGTRLFAGLREVLALGAARSSFVRGFGLSERTIVLPPDLPVAAVGAALLPGLPLPSAARV